jgi:hypothetical protein
LYFKFSRYAYRDKKLCSLCVFRAPRFTSAMGFYIYENVMSERREIVWSPFWLPAEFVSHNSHQAHLCT